MDLDLTIPPARGKRPAAIECSYLRDLDETDVALMQAGYKIDSQTPAIKKLRSAHHELARLLAAGVKEQEAALITGYSSSRISILKNDPAFKNLLSFYSSEKMEVSIEVTKRLSALGIGALEEIQSRLEENPEDFTNEELRKLTETVFDRSGFGPKSTVSVERTIDPALLAALKQSVNEKEAQNVIEVSDYQESPVGDDNGGPALIREEGETLQLTEERPVVSEAVRALAPPSDTFEGS